MVPDTGAMPMFPVLLPAEGGSRAAGGQAVSTGDSLAAAPSDRIPELSKESIDADLRLVSQIGGLRAKSAHAQAASAKLTIAIAEARARESERREEELATRREARERRRTMMTRWLAFSPQSGGALSSCWAAWREAVLSMLRHRCAEAEMVAHAAAEMSSGHARDCDLLHLLTAWHMITVQARHTRALQLASDEPNSHDLRRTLVERSSQVETLRLYLLEERRGRRLQWLRSVISAGNKNLSQCLSVCPVLYLNAAEVASLCIPAWRSVTASGAAAHRRCSRQGGMNVYIGSPRPSFRTVGTAGSPMSSSTVTGASGSPGNITGRPRSIGSSQGGSLSPHLCRMCGRSPKRLLSFSPKAARSQAAEARFARRSAARLADHVTWQVLWHCSPEWDGHQIFLVWRMNVTLIRRARTVRLAAASAVVEARVAAMRRVLQAWRTGVTGMKSDQQYAHDLMAQQAKHADLRWKLDTAVHEVAQLHTKRRHMAEHIGVVLTACTGAMLFCVWKSWARLELERRAVRELWITQIALQLVFAAWCKTWRAAVWCRANLRRCEACFNIEVMHQAHKCCLLWRLVTNRASCESGWASSFAEARISQRRALSAAFSAMLETNCMRQLALAFCAWCSDVSRSRRRELHDQSCKLDRARSTEAARVLALICMWQAENTTERVTIVWHAWRQWVSRQHARKWRDHASEMLTSRQQEQDQKFLHVMESWNATLVTMVDHKVKERDLLLLRQVFGNLALHAKEEQAMRRLQQRERGVVGLFAAERDWLRLQREHHANRVMAHMAGVEVRLAAMECLRCWRREVVAASFVARRVRRMEAYFSMLTRHGETGAHSVCFQAWRVYAVQAMADWQLRALQGRCEQVCTNVGTILHGHERLSLLHVCLEGWYRAFASGVAQMSCWELQARCEELHALLGRERRHRDEITQEAQERYRLLSELQSAMHADGAGGDQQQQIPESYEAARQESEMHTRYTELEEELRMDALSNVMPELSVPSKAQVKHADNQLASDSRFVPRNEDDLSFEDLPGSTAPPTPPPGVSLLTGAALPDRLCALDLNDRTEQFIEKCTELTRQREAMTAKLKAKPHMDHEELAAVLESSLIRNVDGIAPLQQSPSMVDAAWGDVSLPLCETSQTPTSDEIQREEPLPELEKTPPQRNWHDASLPLCDSQNPEEAALDAVRRRLSFGVVSAAVQGLSLLSDQARQEPMEQHERARGAAKSQRRVSFELAGDHTPQFNECEEALEAEPEESVTLESSFEMQKEVDEICSLDTPSACDQPEIEPGAFEHIGPEVDDEWRWSAWSTGTAPSPGLNRDTTTGTALMNSAVQEHGLEVEAIELQSSEDERGLQHEGTDWQLEHLRRTLEDGLPSLQILEEVEQATGDSALESDPREPLQVLLELESTACGEEADAPEVLGPPQLLAPPQPLEPPQLLGPPMWLGPPQATQPQAGQQLHDRLQQQARGSKMYVPRVSAAFAEPSPMFDLPAPRRSFDDSSSLPAPQVVEGHRKLSSPPQGTATSALHRSPSLNAEADVRSRDVVCVGESAMEELLPPTPPQSSVRKVGHCVENRFRTVGRVLPAPNRVGSSEGLATVETGPETPSGESIVSGFMERLRGFSFGLGPEDEPAGGPAAPATAGGAPSQVEHAVAAPDLAIPWPQMDDNRYLHSSLLAGSERAPLMGSPSVVTAPADHLKGQGKGECSPAGTISDVLERLHSITNHLPAK